VEELGEDLEELRQEMEFLFVKDVDEVFRIALKEKGA